MVVPKLPIISQPCRVQKTQAKAICFPFRTAGKADLSKIKAGGSRLKLGRLSTAEGRKKVVAKEFGQGWNKGKVEKEVTDIFGNILDSI